MAVVGLDAESEGISRQRLAEVRRTKITHAVEAYRAHRAPRAQLLSMGYAVAATLAVVVLLFLTVHLFRRLRRTLEPRIVVRIEGLQALSGDVIQTEPLWMLILGVLATARAILTVVILYFYLNFTLSLSPWTRALSIKIFGVVLDPLRTMGIAFIDALPGLTFIVILILVTLYALKVVRVFFAGIARKRITVRGFEPEWALPTYRIIRLFIIVFAVVIAYPHIPGSSTGAFKGVSILLGVMVSLGSSSIIANVIAGYTMIYRRAFRVGDRIKVDDIEGEVSEAGILVTHVRTVKNEDVVVPSSVMLNSNVINYSTLARKEGLILHTCVGIGYETPWRR